MFTDEMIDQMTTAFNIDMAEDEQILMTKL